MRIEGICPEFADCWLSVIVMRDERVTLVVRSKTELLQRDGDGGGAGARKADAIDLAARGDGRRYDEKAAEQPQPAKESDCEEEEKRLGDDEEGGGEGGERDRNGCADHHT